MNRPLAKLVDLLIPKRRWAQFSLSTLFVVVTVLCVGLRLVVVPAERQRRAVAAIKSISGGPVFYDTDDPEYTATFFKTWLRRWLPRDFTDNVVQVGFTGGNSDRDLIPLRSFNGLRHLFIDGEQVTDTGLRQLSGLAELQVLDIGRPVRAFSNTYFLRSPYPPIKVTDVGVGELQKALPNCRITVKR
jgi:hypothetical protein